MADETVVAQLADAIAYAEGFFAPNSRANRNKNPGNLTQDIAGGGAGIGKDGMFIVYATAEDGWLDLKQQVRMMLDDASHIYSSNMTIREVAMRYTTTDQFAWATNVASRMGVPMNTPLRDLVRLATGGSAAIFFIFALIWFMAKGKKK